MAAPSTIAFIFLVFGIVFALLYTATLTTSPKPIPTIATIKPIDAIIIVEDDLRQKGLNYTDARLWPSQLNETASDEGYNKPNLAYIYEAKAHPELLSIPLLYVHPENHTIYYMNTHGSEGQVKLDIWCPKPDRNCISDPDIIQAISGKLVYRVELITPVSGYYFIDATTGKIIYIHLFE